MNGVVDTEIERFVDVGIGVIVPSIFKVLSFILQVPVDPSALYPNHLILNVSPLFTAILRPIILPILSISSSATLTVAIIVGELNVVLFDH